MQAIVKPARNDDDDERRAQQNGNRNLPTLPAPNRSGFSTTTALAVEECPLSRSRFRRCKSARISEAWW